MSRDEILAMTPEQLRVEIARKKGISDISYDYEGNWMGKTNGHVIYFPDYPCDLEATYQLEESIPESGRDYYNSILWYLIAGNDPLCTHLFELIHATAEQRSRAWLIWKEECE